MMIEQTKIIQSPSAVVMIRPHHFSVNPETASDNSFQQSITDLSAAEVALNARLEVDRAIEQLTEKDVNVHVFDDYGTDTPDSVFPNNWFSTDQSGRVFLYPMYCPNRRAERRQDIIDSLSAQYNVKEVIDYAKYELEGLYLESTGAMIFDHVNHHIYAAESMRMSRELLEQFCHDNNYTATAFTALGEDQSPIYHTNVLMTLATDFAIICSEAIVDAIQRQQVLKHLGESGREVIELSQEQVNGFAANALELLTPKGKVVAISTQGYQSLTEQQRFTIGKYAELLPISVPTIEAAGGSVRCMLAGIHLIPKNADT